VNPTDYQLALPKRARKILLSFSDADYVVAYRAEPTVYVPDHRGLLGTGRIEVIIGGFKNVSVTNSL